MRKFGITIRYMATTQSALPFWPGHISLPLLVGKLVDDSLESEQTELVSFA
jgi:hypothetical protein